MTSMFILKYGYLKLSAMQRGLATQIYNYNSDSKRLYYLAFIL